MSPSLRQGHPVLIRRSGGYVRPLLAALDGSRRVLCDFVDSEGRILDVRWRTWFGPFTWIPSSEK